MEAAEALGRSALSTYYEAIREWARTRSWAFWTVAGLTVLAATLRFATLGVQAYHHDEIVTASRVLRDAFWHAMEAVGFSESAPPPSSGRALVRPSRQSGAGAAGDPPDVAGPRRVDRRTQSRAPLVGERCHLRRRRDRRHRRPSRDRVTSGRAAACRPRRACASRRARRSPGAAGRGPDAGRGCCRRRRAAGAGRFRQGLRDRPQPVASACAAADCGGDWRNPARRAAWRHRDRVGSRCLLARLLRLGQYLAGVAASRLGRRRGTLGGTAGAAGDRHLDPGGRIVALLPLDRLLPGSSRRRLLLECA